MTEKKSTRFSAGNRCAAKEKKASAQLQIRLLPEDKAHFAELADVAGLSLSAWVLDAMREKAKRQGKKEGE